MCQTANPSSTHTLQDQHLSKMMSAEFVEAKKQFAVALEAARSIRVRVWSVYRLDAYEEDGSQGTQFDYDFSKPSLEEAFATASKVTPSFIVEELLAADGTRWFLNEADDTRSWGKGKPLSDSNLMAAELSQSPEGYVFDGKNQWVSARIKRNGIENFCAEAVALEPKPKDWKTHVYSKYGIKIVFECDEEYDEEDEEDEEDYDY